MSYIKCKYIDGVEIDIPKDISNSMGSFSGKVTNGFTSVREGSKIKQFLEISKEIKNPIFFDIGSNYGGYSYITLLNTNLKVEAFEPNPSVVQNFNKIIQKNSIPNVNVNSFGLSNENRTCALHVVNPNNIGAASIKVNKDGECIFKSLDSLNVQKMDIVKIDVEGHELEVLEGAKETIKRCKPIFIQIEINRADAPKRLARIKSEYLQNNYHSYKLGVDYLFFRKN
jgi:FkbM family methyltransferase